MPSDDLHAPLHPALVRPILLGGAERELVLANILLILVLLLGVGPHPFTLLVATLQATGGHTLLVLAARYDPQIFRVYARHLRTQSHYPARALHQAPSSLHRTWTLRD